MKTSAQFTLRPVRIGLACLLLASSPLLAADPASPSVTERAKQTAAEVEAAARNAQRSVSGAVGDASDAVKDASRDAARSIENLWRRVDDSRLKNRNRDEIVAWVIVGVLIGALAGAFTTLNTSFSGQIGRLFIGLAGAAVGGLVVRMAKLDFGWGPVLIRYEDLAFAAAGAVVLVLLFRLVSSRSSKKQ